ncbi:MAG: hypothetical protein HZA49_08050 [Planctomycetes bacterium]|nr:hypothetical protein [Planctomycetota bacterium]
MLKMYYIVLVVIVGLVIWLVADFARNSAQARDILSDINKLGGTTGGPTIDLPPSLPPHPGDLPDIFKPRVEVVPVAPPPVTVAAGPNYILTGTIIEPSGPTAFISNPTTNVEYTCKIGTKIDEWEVIEIIPEEVKIRNRNGDIRTLPVQKSWTGPKFDLGGKIEIPPEIINIPGAQDMIKRVSEGKESIEVVEQTIDALAKTLPPAFIRDFIKQNIGLAEEDMPKDDAKLGDFGKNLFRLLQGEQPNPAQSQSLENVTFTLRVNPDNSPVSPQTLFKPGDRRIYACFQNQGSLQGLAKVVTRWTNRTTKEIIGFGPKALNPGTPYNFIWWEKKDGWPVGEYEVELLNAQTLGKIAAGKFSIVP